MSKYTITQIAKSLDKLFSAGFKTDKSILALQLEDLEKLPEVSIQDIGIIVCYKKAIKNKKITEFLAGEEI